MTTIGGRGGSVEEGRITASIIMSIGFYDLDPKKGEKKWEGWGGEGEGKSLFLFPPSVPPPEQVPRKMPINERVFPETARSPSFMLPFSLYYSFWKKRVGGTKTVQNGKTSGRKILQKHICYYGASREYSFSSFPPRLISPPKIEQTSWDI